jgi:diadenosine tetraphosphatase ApaH/serine/threonine PP2A family protein phosphatase
MIAQRTIIIGDVHGCLDELNDLLERLDLDGSERLIFIGDLINKGPDSKGVYERYQSLGAEVVMGNHELGLLDYYDRGIDRPFLVALRSAFGDRFDAFVEDVRTWPLFIDDKDFLAVHGGLVPGQHPRDSDPWLVTSIRTWDGTGDDYRNPENPKWFDLYTGDRLVVFGHWAQLRGVLDHAKVAGLDTGCVYGGKLSALVLPERKVVQVDARETYCEIKS